MSAEIGALGRGAAARMDSLYEHDLAQWALREAALIRAGRLDEADLANLAEEIESLGRSQYASVRNKFRVLLIHLLKWDHQPERRTRSWTLSIRDARDRIGSTVEDSPSLRRRQQEALLRAYQSARPRAALETDLPISVFPEACPYTLDEALERLVLWPDD